MKTYCIGKSPTADIQLDDLSILPQHAELTCTNDGRFYLVDCGSSQGTQVLRGEQWVPLRQAYVLPNEWVRFGQKSCTLGALLAAAFPEFATLAGGTSDSAAS